MSTKFLSPDISSLFAASSNPKGDAERFVWSTPTSSFALITSEEPNLSGNNSEHLESLKPPSNSFSKKSGSLSWKASIRNGPVAALETMITQVSSLAELQPSFVSSLDEVVVPFSIACGVGGMLVYARRTMNRLDREIEAEARPHALVQEVQTELREARVTSDNSSSDRERMLNLEMRRLYHPPTSPKSSTVTQTTAASSLLPKALLKELEHQSPNSFLDTSQSRPNKKQVFSSR